MPKDVVAVKRKILIIGAGFLQNFVIKKAKALGYYTLAIDKNPNSIGFLAADEYGLVDIVDQEACLSYAQAQGIDGVITAATDYGVLPAAYIAQQMSLPGLDYQVAKVIKNKYMVRRTLFEHQVAVISQFYELNSIAQLAGIGNSIAYPVMVKPCDGSGSKAVKKVDSALDLQEACAEAIKASLIDKALIEDFIEGREYGVESFVYEGEVHVLGVMGKHMTSPPDYAEIGHYFPSQLAIEEKVKEVAGNAIKALGINYGAVNMDVLVTEAGQISIVDVGARMGGNLIGSHIIPIGTGIDYMANLIRSAVGDAVDLQPRATGANIATRLLALKPGKVRTLPDFEGIRQQSGVTEVLCHLRVGSEIRQYHNNLDGCGYVVAVADNFKEADSRVELAKHLVDVGIIREEDAASEKGDDRDLPKIHKTNC